MHHSSKTALVSLPGAYIKACLLEPRLELLITVLDDSHPEFLYFRFFLGTLSTRTKNVLLDSGLGILGILPNS